MPKSRSSNSVGSQGSGSERTSVHGGAAPGSPEELADRLVDRISSIQSIIVPTHSSSRGTTDNVEVMFDTSTPGVARVNSASGRSYQVDYENDTCDCPDHRFRGSRCRHIGAVHQAINQLDSQPGMDEAAPTGAPASGIDSNAGNVPNSQGIQDALNDRRRVDNEDEDNRAMIQQVDEDDGFFYSDNNQEFRAALERGAREPLSYDYENALNGSQITFGLEIEFVGGNADAIARELYQLGICGHPYRLGYHSQGVPGKWKLEKDISVSNGQFGGELVSPVLRDTPETWRNLETICEVARRHGAQVNGQCGGHVHMSMDPLDTARQRWRRFFRTIGGFEDVMYRVAGGSLGRVRTGAAHGHHQYASSFAERASSQATARFTLNDENDVRELARTSSGQNRYSGINLTNIYNSNRPNTVEFRYFNSSLDPSQLQANVKIANGIMMASEKARTKDSADFTVSDTMKKRGKLLKDHPMGRNNHRGHSAIKEFVDIVFTRKKDKDTAIGVYAKNSWDN